MNWFHLLKVQRQTQRQGVSARQKDEEFIFEDDDESDCYDEFVRIYEKTKNSFPNARKTKKEDNVIEYSYDKIEIALAFGVPQKGKIPDEVFCEAIKMYKSIEDLASGKMLENHYIEVAKEDDTHYIAIWIKDYSENTADAYIQMVTYNRLYEDGESLDQNIDGWKGEFHLNWFSFSKP